jgi:hypothetical protein
MLVDDELHKHLHIGREIIMWIGQGFDFDICAGVTMSSSDEVRRNNYHEAGY